MASNDWQWKPLDSANAPEILRLIVAIEHEDDSPVRTMRAEVESYFEDSHEWRAQGAWIEDELVAFGLARTRRHNMNAPITISGGVAPQWRERGLGRDLLERQLRSARAVADSLGIGEMDVHMYVESSQAELAELATLYGFERYTEFVQMRRSLDEPLAAPEPSPYLQIVKLSEDWMKDARKAHNRVLAGSTWWTKMSAEMWQARVAAMEEDWCLVALDVFGDRPRLAGYLLASRFSSYQPGGKSVAMFDEGYVEEIVVLPEWRGKNVASALIKTAMERFGSAGLSYIGLDLSFDSEGDGAALVTLFEHLDFQRVAHTNILTTRV